MVDDISGLAESLLERANTYSHNIRQYQQYGTVAPEVLLAVEATCKELTTCSKALKRVAAKLSVHGKLSQVEDFVDLTKRLTNEHETTDAT